MKFVTPLLRAAILLTAVAALPACGTLGRPALEASPELAAAKDHFAAQRYGLALDGYTAALAQSPGSVVARNGIAASYAMLGRRDLAERHFHKVLADHPFDWRTLNNLGNFYLTNDRPDVALVYLAAAAGAAPDRVAVVGRNAARAEAALADRDKLVVAAADATADRPELAPDRTMLVERVTAHVQRLRTRRQIAASEPGYRLRATAPLRRATGRTAAGRARDLAAVAPVTTEPLAAPVRAGEATVEVTNGAGMRHMAAAVRAYLARSNFPVDRIANAQHFRHQESVVFYRPGFEAIARQLQATLPGTPRLVRRARQDVDVRLRLGGDLVPLARRFLTQV